MTVVLPQPTEEQIGVDGGGLRRARRPVLYLLHGLSDDHTAWQRYTVGRAVRRGGRPRRRDAGRAPQLLHQRGARSPLLGLRLRGAARIVARLLPRLRPARGDLRGRPLDGRVRRPQARPHPSRAVRRGSLAVGRPRPGATCSRARARRASSTGSSAATVTRRRTTCSPSLRQASGVPPLYLGCGTEDPLLAGTDGSPTRRAPPGVDVTLDLRPGSHEWSLWDAMIADVIAWLPPRPGAGDHRGRRP